MRNSLQIVIIASFFYSISIDFVFAQNVRFASYDSIMKSIPSYLKAVAGFNEKLSDYEKQLKTLEQNYSEKLESFTKKYPNDLVTIQKGDEKSLQPEVAKEYDMLKKEKDFIDSQSKSFNELLQLFYDNNILVIKNKVNAIVKAYCIKNKIKSLFNLDIHKKDLLFYDTTEDITYEIIRELKQKY